MPAFLLPRSEYKTCAELQWPCCSGVLFSPPCTVSHSCSKPPPSWSWACSWGSTRLRMTCESNPSFFLQESHRGNSTPDLETCTSVDFQTAEISSLRSSHRPHSRFHPLSRLYPFPSNFLWFYGLAWEIKPLLYMSLLSAISLTLSDSLLGFLPSLPTKVRSLRILSPALEVFGRGHGQEELCHRPMFSG